MTSEQQREPIEYVIATLIAIVTILLSLGGAVGFSVGPNPPVDRVTGAAWAWAIGGLTMKYWVPWVKQAVRPVGGVDDAE